MVAYNRTLDQPIFRDPKFKTDQQRLIISPGLITFQASMVTVRGGNVQTQKPW
jgi:hypothetical protein